jgi:hypothetical protein
MLSPSVSTSTSSVERGTVARLEQPVAAEHGEPRLLLGRDDLEDDSGFLPHPFDELAAVDGAAAGFGGDRAGEGDPAPAQLVGADGEGGDGAVLRRVADLAAGAQAFPEPDDPREGVDDGEALVGRPGDEKAAIVGAEVEGAIAGAVRVAPHPGRNSCRRRRTLCRRKRSRRGLLRHA